MTSYYSKHRRFYRSRPRFACTCVVCGRKFNAFRPHAKYCSNRCLLHHRREQSHAAKNPSFWRRLWRFIAFWK